MWMEAHKAAAIQLCQELQWEILITEDISVMYSPIRALLGQPRGKRDLAVAKRCSNQHSWALPGCAADSCSSLELVIHCQILRPDLVKVLQTRKQNRLTFGNSGKQVLSCRISAFPVPWDKLHGHRISFGRCQAIVRAGGSCPGTADLFVAERDEVSLTVVKETWGMVESSL